MSDIEKSRQRSAAMGQHCTLTDEQRGERGESHLNGRHPMDDAKEIRVALEKEFARLRTASVSAEARLKSVSNDFATRVLAIEKMVKKEFAPNVSARLRAIEKGLVAYKKASKMELTRLKKSYDRELTKLRKAKGGVATKISKSSNAEPATKKPASAKAGRSTQAKTRARKAPSSRRRKTAVSTTTKRAGPKMTTSGKAGSATKTSTRKTSTRKTSTRKKPAAKL